MSNNDNLSNLSPDKEEKILTNAEDVKAAFDFWKQFDIPVPEYLQKAVDNFIAEQTFSNQQDLKYAVTKAIATTDHEAFNDETFKKVKEECADVSYEMEFNKDFENAVGEEVVEKK